MPTRKTTEQERAASAWDNVNQLDGTGEKTQKKYGSLARGLPAMIQTNGLGQTLAFLRAKGKGDRQDHQQMLYDHVAKWGFRRLTGDNEAKQLPDGSRSTADLLEWLIHNDSAVYRRATTEALTYALWLRRFAEAKGWGEEGGSGND